MNYFNFDNHWEQIKGQLKQRYAELTDDDLLFVEGKAEELVGRLGLKLALTQSQVYQLLEDLNTSVENDESGIHAKIGEEPNRVRQFAEGVRSRATAAAEQVKTKAGVAAQRVKARTGEAYEHTRQTARSWQEDSTSYIRQNPRSSICAALAVGFVAGLLIRR